MICKTRLPRLLLLGLVLISLLTPSFAETRQERMVAPGVTFTEIHRQTPKGEPWAIYVLQFDRKEPTLSFRTTKGRDRVLGNETVRRMSERIQAPGGQVVAAVNADFYWTDKPYIGQPVGVMIKGGELLTSPFNGRPVFGISDTGEPMLGDLEFLGSVKANEQSYKIDVLNKARSAGGDANVLALYTESFGPSAVHPRPGTDIVLKNLQPALPLKAGSSYTGTVAEVRTGVSETTVAPGTVVLSGEGDAAAFLEKNLPVGRSASFSLALKPDWSRVSEATGVWPTIVHDGKIITGIAPSLANPRHPRTAVGWDDSHLVFAAVDGRQTSHSVGMNLTELGQLMIEFGCKEAANLDGGGSTTLVVRGDVMNRPSDGVDRAVSNGWAVVSTAPPGELKFLKMTPPNPSVLTGSRLSFRLIGTDAFGAPVPVDPGQVKWTVNAALGTVDDNGVFIAASPARAGRMIASVGDVSSGTTINVWDAPAKVFIVPGKLTLAPGSTAQLSVHALDRAGHPMIVDPAAVTWSVSGAGVALGPDGKVVVGTTPGTFTVTAALAGVNGTLAGEVK